MFVSLFGVFLFLSTLSLRRATLRYWSRAVETTISIHALLAESDSVFFIIFNACCAFLSTLSLRRATGENKKIKVIRIFLSTLSLRRATYQGQAGSAGCLHFYPRSPCGERPDQTILKVYGYGISIHALLAESDYCQGLLFFRHKKFLSTLSLRRATVTFELYSSLCQDFYPRSPCGERLRNPEAVSKYMIFLSTLSLRRATPKRRGLSKYYDISIHALLAESDSVIRSFMTAKPTFLSTLSLRRATGPVRACKAFDAISIHALLAESDASTHQERQAQHISIHALLAESD